MLPLCGVLQSWRVFLMCGLSSPLIVWWWVIEVGLYTSYPSLWLNGTARQTEFVRRLKEFLIEIGDARFEFVVSPKSVELPRALSFTNFLVGWIFSFGNSVYYEPTRVSSTLMNGLNFGDEAFFCPISGFWAFYTNLFKSVAYD